MARNGRQPHSVCGRPFGRDEAMPLDFVRDSILDRIRCDLREEIATHSRTVEVEGRRDW